MRYAAHGLTDEQATARPTVSELSLAGLVKHVALVRAGLDGRTSCRRATPIISLPPTIT